MTKFFALLMTPASVVDEWKKNTKPEERKSGEEKMMRDWEKWQKAHQRNLVEAGAPLGKTKRVSSNKISDVRNDLNWYMIVEAESHDAAARLFEDNPHLQIPGSSIEVMEIPARPQM